jgi:hypothetical protein
VRGVAIIVVLGLGAGCAGELENPERFAECAPGFVEQLFQEKCAGQCHAGADPEAGLDLASPGAGTRVMGRASVQEACEGLMIVDPTGGDSLLVDKLTDTPPCGARMPFGQSKLSGAEVECVRRWVDEVVAAGGGQ